jgi:hypothetical protein
LFFINPLYAIWFSTTFASNWLFWTSTSSYIAQWVVRQLLIWTEIIEDMKSLSKWTNDWWHQIGDPWTDLERENDDST